MQVESLSAIDEAKSDAMDSSLLRLTGTNTNITLGSNESSDDEEKEKKTNYGAVGNGCSAGVGSYGASDSLSDVREGVGSSGRMPTLTAFHQQRYSQFLEAYFGYGAEQRVKCIRQAAQLCMIGLGLHKKVQGRNADLVHAMRHFIRHSVLAVEGDAAFVKLVQRAKWLWGDEGDAPIDDPRHWPNARCIALHYGLPPTEFFQAANDESNADSPRALHQQQGQFPSAALMAVVATTSIKEGESIRLCLRSYYRCLDEASWYERVFGTRCIDDLSGMESATRGKKNFRMWPNGLPFYHGVGQRHAGVEPVAGFPFTLLNLTEATEIGENEKGLFAAHPVPYGTCFLYCGPAIATKIVEARRKGMAAHESTTASAGAFITTSTSNGESRIGSDKKKNDDGVDGDDTLLNDIPIDDATYALGLGKHGVCFGQGLMRYVNHRYNLSRFGNVELCSVMLSVTSEFSSLAAELERRRNGASRYRKKQTQKKGRGALRQRSDKAFPLNTLSNTSDVRVTVKKKRRYRPLIGRRIFLEEHSHFVMIPFFIATTDIEVGQQLLAWTYGEEYDARLERQVVCDGYLVPYSDAEVLDARALTGQRQRYKGDYRYSMGTGDIVWCRRPAPDGWRDPVEDLFVVVEVSPWCTDYVLLRPITSRHVPEKALLHPHLRTGDEAVLFDVCATKVLDLCVIAQVNTVAMLLDDMDYWTLPKAKRVSPSSPNSCGSGICGCGGGSICMMYHIVVNAPALRAATWLVLETGHKVTKTTTHLSGQMWPLMHGRGGTDFQCIRKRNS